MDTKHIAIGALALMLLTSLAFWIAQPTKVVQQVVDGAKQTFGANGPISPFNYSCVGGVCTYTATMSLTQAASTTCYLQSPAATSTLLNGGVRFTLASTSAVIVDLGRSANQYSTTTAIGTTYNVAAGAQAMIAASTTPTGGDAVVFPPNTFFNVKFAQTGVGSAGAGSAPTGTCSATWIAYP